MQTYRGVYLDIKESDIYGVYENYKFFFSSLFNKNRFINRLNEYITLENTKIKNKYKIDKINLDLFFAIVFYTKIEKRGFKIVDMKRFKIYDKKEDIEFIIKIKE